jgi:hypothetical protein
MPPMNAPMPSFSLRKMHWQQVTEMAFRECSCGRGLEQASSMNAVLFSTRQVGQSILVRKLHRLAVRVGKTPRDGERLWTLGARAGPPDGGTNLSDDRLCCGATLLGLSGISCRQ